MMIIMNVEATETQVEVVVERIKSNGFQTRLCCTVRSAR